MAKAGGPVLGACCCDVRAVAGDEQIVVFPGDVQSGSESEVSGEEPEGAVRAPTRERAADISALTQTGALSPPEKGGVASEPGGDGLDRMGGAVAAVSLTGTSLPDCKPSPGMDLRQFLRAGDILNYLGGNMWGHVVLVLGTPRAYQVPCLYDVHDEGDPELKELARDVPLYVAKVLQSASNMSHIGISTCAMVIHPVTQEICPVKQGARSHMQLCSGREGHISMEVLLSPLNNQTMDFDSFVLAVEECHRMPQDTKWSLRTAVRSYIRTAELRRSKYTSDQTKEKLAADLCALWRKRPICSTIPPRVWQKYLLKVSYQSGAPNPEVAWSESVLRYMPLKDDRALPTDVVSALLGTGTWTRLDLDQGPPEHRLSDGAPSSVFYDKRWVPLRRPELAPRQTNRDGALVELGDNEFNVYCGRQVAKPQKIEARVGHSVKIGEQMEWDGKCGPNQGPQCSACRWLEDRLDPLSRLVPIQAK